MVFSCLPPQTDCEWANLRDFVVDFNADHETAYAREECLDKDTTRKQPEVLLRAPGERDIVIECKSVVWPKAYYRSHSHEHHLDERVSDLVGHAFRDKMYELAYHEDSLKGVRRRDVDWYAEEIAQTILSNLGQAKSGVISSKVPIPWSFRPLAPHELYEDETTGIRFHVALGSMPWEEPSDYSQRLEALKAGYAGAFQRTLEKAVPKFEGYADCLKLLLVQFCGEGSNMLFEEDLIEIIEAASLPPLIDQVWLACEEWKSDYYCRIKWERIRCAESPLPPVPFADAEVDRRAAEVR